MAPTDVHKLAEHQYGQTQVRLELEKVFDVLEPTGGKIWAGANGIDTYTGTGVLVGRNLLPTASHTVLWNKDGW